MGLLDDVKEEIGTHLKGRPCSVRRALETLAPDESAELQRLLDLPKEDYPHAAISRALGRRDMRVPPDQIGKHRRGECCRGPR